MGAQAVESLLYKHGDIRSQMWWLLEPQQRQANPWGFKAIQLRLIIQFQASERPCLKQTKRWTAPDENQYPKLSFDFFTYICTCTPEHTHILTCMCTHSKSNLILELLYRPNEILYIMDHTNVNVCYVFFLFSKLPLNSTIKNIWVVGPVRLHSG